MLPALSVFEFIIFFSNVIHVFRTDQLLDELNIFIKVLWV